MTSTDRRSFLRHAALAAASFTIVPRHVLGGTALAAPNDKLNIACVGLGGMGRQDAVDVSTENIVALCDVDAKHAAPSFNKFPDAKKYDDFRRMFDKEKNIDAVVVATPDHSHAAVTMAALELGKHVFCEKPLTYSIAEARKVAEAAKKAGVATQMGIQGHAMESFRLLCEWIWDGAIGEVHEVHAWTPHPVWPQGLDRPKETPPVPDTLNWDLWLGPAPERPYHPWYLPRVWRGWIDFGTGGLGDMGCHIFDHIVTSLKLGPPQTVEATASTFVQPGGGRAKWKNTESWPQAQIVTFHFPAREGFPPLKLMWYDGGLMPPRPQELEDGRRMGDDCGGAIYVGTKGTIITGSHGANGVRLIPESRMQEYKQPTKTLPRVDNHYQEWIRACKGDGKTGAPFDYAGPLTETVLLGNVALRSGERIRWDSAAMRVTNCDAANEYLQRAYRKGWSL